MSLPTITDAEFDTRWAAWLDRGRVQDERTRRHWRIALPLLALIAGGGSYFLWVR